MKRTGVAVSDPLKIFASPLQTVPTAKIIDYLQKYASEQTITLFVVGYPLNMDGNPSQMAAHVDAFLKQLEKKLMNLILG